MNIIRNALTQGYSYDNVMEFLLRRFPHARRQIETAIARGFSAEKIIKYLSGGRNEVNAPTTEHEKTLLSDKEKQRNLAKKIGTGALIAGGAALAGTGFASRALQAGSSILGGALPRDEERPVQQIPQKNIPQLQNPSSGPINPEPQVGPSHVGPTIGQQVAQQASQPVGQSLQPNPSLPTPQAPQEDLGALLDQLGIRQKVDALRNNNPPEIISKVIASQLPRDQLKAIQDNKIPLDQIIGEYVKQTPQMPNMQQRINQGESSAQSTQKRPATIEYIKSLHDAYKKQNLKIPFSKVIQSNTDLSEEESARIAKAFTEKQNEEPTSPQSNVEQPNRMEIGRTVSLPDGKTGTVEGIRQGIASIEADGKKYHRKEEDLIESPFSNEELINQVQDILNIPEIDRSSIVSLFNYDPVDKQIFIQFHNGTTTKYLDVDPEKVFRIANKMGIPVSEGKNIFGAWSPKDKKSLGATLIQEIIRDPKYKKSPPGQEPNPNYRNLETLYDYWELLRKKPKKKHQ